ncbi:unnamed protein product [Amoebophrya sp. A120]|nr:unnamed protein product [Amoebophrya sp. A120]|eukprot:GSA120T00018622001.1
METNAITSRRVPLQIVVCADENEVARWLTNAYARARTPLAEVRKEDEQVGHNLLLRAGEEESKRRKVESSGAVALTEAMSGGMNRHTKDGYSFPDTAVFFDVMETADRVQAWLESFLFPPCQGWKVKAVMSSVCCGIRAAVCVLAVRTPPEQCTSKSNILMQDAKKPKSAELTTPGTDTSATTAVKKGKNNKLEHVGVKDVEAQAIPDEAATEEEPVRYLQLRDMTGSLFQVKINEELFQPLVVPTNMSLRKAKDHLQRCFSKQPRPLLHGLSVCTSDNDDESEEKMTADQEDHDYEVSEELSEQSASRLTRSNLLLRPRTNSGPLARQRKRGKTDEDVRSAFGAGSCAASQAAFSPGAEPSTSDGKLAKDELAEEPEEDPEEALVGSLCCATDTDLALLFPCEEQEGTAEEGGDQHENAAAGGN